MHPTRIFKHPDKLKEAWELFKIDLKEQSKDWPKIQYVGKDGERVIDYPVLPITLEGFYRFCRKSYGEVEQYFTNQDECYNDFIGICSACKEERREHQIVGGMIGQFNPSITQRLNGLKESQDINLMGVPIMNVDPLNDRK